MGALQVWCHYLALRKTIYRFKTVDELVRLVDEAWAKRNVEACIAIALHFLEARAARPMHHCILPASARTLSGANTWSSCSWGPANKILLTESRDVEGSEAFGFALAHMIRSFLEMQSPVASATDRAYRAELNSLRRHALALQDSWNNLLSTFDASDKIYRKILVESGCLTPMLRGERINLDLLYEAAAKRRDELTQHYQDGEVVGFDPVLHEVIGSVITQEHQEHEEYGRSTPCDDDQSASGTATVLDGRYLGGIHAPADGAP